MHVMNTKGETRNIPLYYFEPRRPFQRGGVSLRTPGGSYVHERMPCADQPGARPCRSSVGVSPTHYRVSSDHSWRGKNIFLVTRNVKIPAKKRNKNIYFFNEENL
jgi:hypothetical protein